MRTPDSVSCRYAVTFAIFSRTARYAPAEKYRNAALPSASSGKVERNTTTASSTSSSSRITIVPIRVSELENSVTIPSVTSWSSACTSLVRREIRTPVLRRLKKPIDWRCRCVKIRRRRSCSARCPTHPTR